MNKIVVLGSSNTDLVVKTGRMPQPGETLLGDKFMMTAGGKGANQAVAVARLGDGVTFIAKVGRDMFGDGAVAGYEKEGIDTRTVLRDDEAPSGIALITVDGQGENSIVVVPGANNNLSKADVDALHRDIESAEYLLMQLETPVDVVAHAAAIARRAGVRVILNPAPAAELPAELLAGLYMITPNRTESQMLTGIEITDWESAERAAQALIDKGVANAVITLGSQGALVYDGTTFERILAQKVTATDTTAAGDTFNGAMCVALSEGASLSDAVRFASRASAIAVTRLGAQASIPFRSELESGK
ncbi:MAG: ribokinase [Alistipes sp.]|nr:ribokinase [Alistipes senegalensis]MCM1250606.1 ribokinase [Alistipes sp.]